MLDAALALSGLSFPEDDRKSLLQAANQNLARYAELRAIHIPNDVSPPFYFNPIVAGMKVDRQREPRYFSVPRVRRPANLEDTAFWPVNAGSGDKPGTLEYRRVPATYRLAQRRQQPPALRRGAMGNGSKLILAIPFALNRQGPATTIIEVCGVRHTITIGTDELRREPRIGRPEEQIVKTEETRLRIPADSSCSQAAYRGARFLQMVQGFALFYPHAEFVVELWKTLREPSARLQTEVD
jgi:hypothetical protein